MAAENMVATAMAIGRSQAKEVLALRQKALQLRARAIEKHREPTVLVVQAVRGETLLQPEPAVISSAGILVAEGDSWFDYPFHDVLKELYDRYAYDVESVAHRGDPVEAMAYDGNQLEDFSRRIEKVIGGGVLPTAILLSGGGNDVAGTEFGMLLNHARSAIAGLNDSVVDGVINQRIFGAYITILSAVTDICVPKTGSAIPILIHGYDYPVPDGRGFLGGWPFPGPWLEPGFRGKGFEKPRLRIAIAHDLIDRFNKMIEKIPKIKGLGHVRYVDLRGTLSTGDDYEKWWANELHPTPRGFRRVTEKFAAVLKKLPTLPPAPASRRTTSAIRAGRAPARAHAGPRKSRRA